MWVNNKYKDFKYYLFHHDPILSLFCNIEKIEWNELFMIILFVLNILSILATATASIGFNKHQSDQTPNKYPNYKINNINTFSLNDTFSMIICSIFNGLILCIFTLKWRQFESKKRRKLSTFIMNTNGITLILFILCILTLSYYFLMNELTFFSWFVAIYAGQFIFGWIFEILLLYISFIRGWKYDHKMTQLIPNYLNDGSFSHCSLPKSVYYITYKDYEQWLRYKQTQSMHTINLNNDEFDDTEDSASELIDGEHSSQRPLLNNSTNNTNNYKFTNW